MAGVDHVDEASLLRENESIFTFNHSGNFARCFAKNDAMVLPWSGLWTSASQSPSITTRQVCAMPPPSFPNLKG